MRKAILLLALLLGCGDEHDGVEGVATPPPPEETGPDPFDQAEFRDYDVEIDPADWDALVADPFDETVRTCTVTWLGEVYANCALRPAGDRSRIAGNPKPSFKVEFDEFIEDQEFHGYSTLKFDSMIDDLSLMRCRLQYPVYSWRGIPSPKYAHCRMYVNGEYKGVYGVEERVKKEFVKKHFGLPLRQLYSWNASDTMHDLIWGGTQLSLYVPEMWVTEIDSQPPEAEGVRALCNALNNNIAALPDLFDIPAFLNFIAVETILGEGDNYVGGTNGTRSANIRMYRPPATNKYMLLPWDCDQGYWRSGTSLVPMFQNRVLTQKLILENAANRAQYEQILLELIEGPYATDVTQARVDFVYEQIRDAVYEDPVKPGSNAQFDARVASIRSYIAARNAAFLDQIDP